jgi:hypothetical protein
MKRLWDWILPSALFVYVAGLAWLTPGLVIADDGTVNVIQLLGLLGATGTAPEAFGIISKAATSWVRDQWPKKKGWPVLKGRIVYLVSAVLAALGLCFYSMMTDTYTADLTSVDTWKDIGIALIWAIAANELKKHGWDLSKKAPTN